MCIYIIKEKCYIMGLWPIDTGWNLLGTLEKVPYFCGVALTELWHEDLN